MNLHTRSPLRGRGLVRVLLAAAALLGPAAPPSAAQVAPAAVSEPADPEVRPGDMIRLEIWREEELTGEYLVDQRYRVTLPIIGEIDVRGETELSLRTRVRDELTKSVWNPSIQLFVLKRLRVIGAVMEPGLVHLDATMSVADALALVGGRTPEARESDVRLRRDGQVVVTDVKTETLLSELAVRTGDELFVPERSWMSRNLPTVVTGTVGVLGVVVALIR